jgi:16S rRNA (cytosine1402-N4)-methyltransferase
MVQTYHNPVLLNECIDGLNINPNGVYVDVTFGGGGHSRAILAKLDKGRLIAFDQDEDAKRNSIDDSRFTLVQQNFMYMSNFLNAYKLLPVDGILADLGISSHHIDDPVRGFSTRFDGPLDMRMNRSTSLTAEKVLNEYEITDLTRILKQYADLQDAYRISKRIALRREEKKFESTADFADFIKSFTPPNKSAQYQSRVFQAIRMEVNNEIEVLKRLITDGTKSLKEGGRFAVISYHSGEDKLVKNFFASGNFDGEPVKDFYGNLIRPLKPVHRGVITPTDEELLVNPRARSAKLRIAEKIAA